eukprot:TRINITY_DN10891_c0_g1_i4.p2 TRINITY_DN10891_c0_g1~~TRINITY_DN10891_c0_g1_i4.p2  ORF type:complete len:144 (-),score=40.00 TRINITY_DN10891_c0_g1_i4:107-538(-)
MRRALLVCVFFVCLGTLLAVTEDKKRGGGLLKRIIEDISKKSNQRTLPIMCFRAPCPGFPLEKKKKVSLAEFPQVLREAIKKTITDRLGKRTIALFDFSSKRTGSNKPSSGQNRPLIKCRRPPCPRVSSVKDIPTRREKKNVE